ncbi:MAG: hypothetical protein ACRESX_00440 [Gammaproteobacteria bacterium]
MHSAEGWANWDGQVFGGALGDTGLQGPPKNADGAGGKGGGSPGRQPTPNQTKVPYHPAGGGRGPTVGTNPVPGSVGVSLGADTAVALEYGAKLYGPAVTSARSVGIIADTAQGIGHGLTGLNILLDALKLGQDLRGPVSPKQITFDSVNLTVNVVAFKTHNGYVIAGVAGYDFIMLIQENAPAQCESVCTIQNQINLIQMSPAIQQAFQQGVPIPGFPGP